MSKYSIGDRVIVVHRLDGDGYYSYKFEGSIGTVDAIGPDMLHDGDYIYKLNHDILNTENCTEDCDNVFTLACNAWYQECCLDPAPANIEVDDEEFEEVLK